MLFLPRVIVLCSKLLRCVGTAGSHYCSMAQDSLDLGHLADQFEVEIEKYALTGEVKHLKT